MCPASCWLGRKLDVIFISFSSGKSVQKKTWRKRWKSLKPLLNSDPHCPILSNSTRRGCTVQILLTQISSVDSGGSILTSQCRWLVCHPGRVFVSRSRYPFAYPIPLLRCPLAFHRHSMGFLMMWGFFVVVVGLLPSFFPAVHKTKPSRQKVPLERLLVRSHRLQILLLTKSAVSANKNKNEHLNPFKTRQLYTHTQSYEKLRSNVQVLIGLVNRAWSVFVADR